MNPVEQINSESATKPVVTVEASLELPDAIYDVDEAYLQSFATDAYLKLVEDGKMGFRKNQLRQLANITYPEIPIDGELIAVKLKGFSVWQPGEKLKQHCNVIAYIKDSSDVEKISSIINKLVDILELQIAANKQKCEDSERAKSKAFLDREN
jgi:hypothetical protein